MKYIENSKRVTIFAGHYGSGKTNIAINFAKELKKSGRAVALADLDIVNPYFRSKDSELHLQATHNLVFRQLQVIYPLKRNYQ